MTPDTLAAAAQQFRIDSSIKTADMRLVFDVTLYLPAADQPQWEGVLDFYKKALPRLRDQVKYYAFDGRRKHHKITPDVFEALSFWASRGPGERSLYGLLMRGGGPANGEEEASEQWFDFYHDGADPSYLRLCLPPEFGFSPGLGEVVLDLVRNVPFLFGTTGFAALSEHSYDSTKVGGPTYALSRRFKCVDFGTPLYFANFVAHGIKTVSWMTFVGGSHLAALGDRKKLVASAKNGIQLHELPHGLAFQIGDQPILGDVNQLEDLTAYRSVNRLLQSVRFSDTVLGPFDEIGDEENTREWMHRFDEP